LEDLHWSDLSTLDWIAAFAQRPEPACLLLIGTYRPLLAMTHEHPLAAISDHLRMKGFCREIALHGLDETSVADYAALRCPPAPARGNGCAAWHAWSTSKPAVTRCLSSTQLTIWPHVGSSFRTTESGR
jgi:hypothetical protein